MKRIILFSLCLWLENQFSIAQPSIDCPCNVLSLTRQQVQNSMLSDKSFDSTVSSQFSKLINANLKGFSTNFNDDKSTLDFSYGSQIKKSAFFLQGKGTIGTTTNLFDLFSQSVLPTLSIEGTVNILIRNRQWFDATYSENMKEIQKGNYNISTEYCDENGHWRISKFKYSKTGLERAKKEKDNKSLYTFKHFQWVNITGAFENSKYVFYEANRDFDSQIYKPTFHTGSGKITYNLIWIWNHNDVEWINKRTKKYSYRPNFIYLNFGLRYGLTNNTQLLKKVTINDVTTVDTNKTTYRQLVKSQTAYIGTLQEYKTVKPSFELLFSPCKYLALDILGEYNLISDGDKNKYGIGNNYNLSTGIYFLTTSEKSKFNIGVYYKWNVDKTDNSTTKQLSLRTSIPINP